MTVRFFPVFITIFASLIPIFGQLFSVQAKEITYLPLVAVVVLGLLARSSYRSTYRELATILTLAFYLLISLLLGKGIGSGGTIIVVVLAYLFKRFFLLGHRGFERDLDSVVSYVIFIYKFNIAVVYAELLVVLAGYQNNLKYLLTTSDVLPGYKGYNHAHFLQVIGFDVTGLGGVYLGSQAAGMMAVMSVVVFFQLRSYVRFWALWLLSALGAVLFCSNMTALLMLAVAVCLFIFVFYRHHYSFKNRLLLLLLLPLCAPLIFYKIDNASELNTYLDAFLPSVEIFVDNLMNFRVLELLFGYGSTGHYKYSSEAVELGTDFGLMTLVNQAGLILFFVCLLALAQISRLSLAMRHILIRTHTKSENRKLAKFYNLIVTNVIIVNIFFVSLIHYTSAIEIGMRELWALHIGVAMAIISKFKDRYFAEKSN